MAAIDYEAARALLEKTFITAEAALVRGEPPPTQPDAIAKAVAVIFASNTQAYREVLLGCAIARLSDGAINIRKPYVEQGDDAFSGRTLDERVVNPFLQHRQIPCCKGPYLSVFRRSVQFNDSIRSGLRDKAAYDAFLLLISYLEETDEQRQLTGFLEYLLHKFAELREASNVPLLKLQRISLEQYEALIAMLLGAHSGGLFALLMVTAMFRTIRAVYSLDWEVMYQGINVADSASGAGGDITISEKGQTLLAVEVTERQIGKARVVATFNTKIAPSGLEDYLFVSSAGVDLDARRQARNYFAQGHEVNFVDVDEWLRMLLSTLGKGGRATFNTEFMDLLELSGIPKALKVAWNEYVNTILTV